MANGLQGARHHINLNASDDPAVSARYGVNGIPHQVIISPASIVLDSWAGYGQGLLEQRLKHTYPIETGKVRKLPQDNFQT